MFILAKCRYSATKYWTTQAAASDDNQQKCSKQAHHTATHRIQLMQWKLCTVTHIFL